MDKALKHRIEYCSVYVIPSDKPFSKGFKGSENNYSCLCG
jgi:hypothetical protein